VFGKHNMSVSQLGQDRWVLQQTKNKLNGYFVEFGAVDGVMLSNTLVLERDFFWNGIVAEPNPMHHAALRRNRSCAVSTKCIYTQSNTVLTFLDCGNDADNEHALSTLADFATCDQHAHTSLHESKSIQVETITLLDLLKQYNAPNKIDYLSIDTEGSEYDILSTFDWTQYDISLITVEHNYTPMRQKIYELLTSLGYRRVQEADSRWDDWYTKL
jgi:FkbM family methyltransferase